MALAWLMHRAPDIVPIPGTRRIARLEENAAAVALSLTAEEDRHLTGLLSERAVAGTRYPAAAMASLDG
jgi:aryl-alcohol dehydrogenase-like predicted oxidoreductase